MVVGTIIGASIFVQPSLVSGAVPSPAGMLLVWAAAWLLTLLGVLSYGAGKAGKFYGRANARGGDPR